MLGSFCERGSGVSERNVMVLTVLEQREDPAGSEVVACEISVPIAIGRFKACFEFQLFRVRVE